MGLFSFFRRKLTEYRYARMLSGGVPVFSQFGDNIYASDVVQSCVNCIVSELRKLNPRHIIRQGNDTRTTNRTDIQSVLDNPNPLMTTSEFLEKIIWRLFLDFNSFVYPVYDGAGKLQALYPLAPSQVEFLQDASDTLYVRMSFQAGQSYTLPYSRVIHLKYRYSVNEFMGGNSSGQPDNGALLQTLELNNTLLQGLGKAMKASFGINGVVKFNTMVDKDGVMAAAIDKMEKQLQAGESGLLGLGLQADFIQLTRDVKLVDADTLKFLDEKILRQYGVSLPILTGDYTTEQLSAFYQKTLEPLIISLGQAFSKVLFSPTERAFGNRVEFYPAELIFMNTDQKLEMVRLLGDSGALFENEKRSAFGLPPIRELEGVRTQSLNYVNSNLASQYQVGQYGQTPQTQDGKTGDNNE